MFGVVLALLGLLIAPLGAQAASPQLTDRATAAGIFLAEHTWAASTVDYNLDGRQDLWIGFHEKGGGRLYRNNGDDTYTWVATSAWPHQNAQGGIFDRHDCQWADVDGNGLPDAYCSGGRNLDNYVKTAEKDNELWLQVSDGNFVDVGTEWGVGDPCGRGRYIAMIDVNGDGRKDIFLGNQAPRNDPTDPCMNPANALPNAESKVFINNAWRSFTYAPAWNVSQPNSGVLCAEPWDYNHDGRMDLLACNFHNHRPYLYRNTGTGFVERGAVVGLPPMSDANLADLNADGLLDLVFSDDQGFAYMLGTTSGVGPVVRIYSAPSGILPASVAVGDINNDGRPDIYGLNTSATSSVNPDDFVFINNGLPNFTVLTVPAAAGRGDAVAAVRPNAASGSQFVVLNGKLSSTGPVQLIAYAP